MNQSIYTIRIETPADFTGIDGVRPRMEQVAAGAAKAKKALHDFNEEVAQATTGKNFTQRLDEQIAAMHEAANAAEALHRAQLKAQLNSGDWAFHADRKRESDYSKGLDKQISAMLAAGHAGDEAMRARFNRARESAEERFGGKGAGLEQGTSGLGGFVAMAGRAAPVLATLGAGIKLVTAGFEEFAENEQAEIALRKFGISAEEAAKQAELIENLDLFTDNKVEAASLYGRVMNGNVRELVQYGIKLDENATKQDRLRALQLLAARGAEKQATESQTLTGSLKILGKGVADAAGEFLGWAIRVTGVTGLLGGLNKALGFTKEEAAQSSKSLEALNKIMSDTPDAAEELAVSAKKAANAFAGLRGEVEAAMQRVELFQALTGKAEKKPSDEELEDLKVKVMEAEGASPIEVAEKKRDIEERRAAEKRQTDADNALRQKTEAEATLRKLDESERNNNSGPVAQRLDALQARTRVSMPAKTADFERLKNLREKEEKLEAELKVWMGQEKTAGSAQSISQIRSELGKNRQSQAAVNERISKAGLTQAEREEFDKLREQQAAEKELINAQRRKAIQAKEDAEEIQRGLPKRREAAELKKRIQDAEIARLKGQQEMQQAQSREEMQAKQRERELAEEDARAEHKERGDEATKKINKTLEAAGDKFLGDFGRRNRGAQESLTEAKKAAQKRLHDMPAKDAEEQAEDIINQELRKHVKSDKDAAPYEAGAGTAGHRLRPRTFQSPADTKGSGLDHLQNIQSRPKAKPVPAAPTAPEAGNLRDATNALQGAAAGIAGLGAFADVAKKLQAEVNRINAKLDKLDTTATK